MIETGSLSIDFGAVNWFAVGVAFILAFAFQMVYYMPFAVGNAWMDALGKTAEEMQEQNSNATPFVVAIIGTTLSVMVIAILVQVTGVDTLVGGLIIGVIVAVGIKLAPTATMHIFEGRSRKLYIITAIENSISFIIISLILTLWQ